MTVATGTSTLNGPPATARNGLLATRTHSDIRLVGAPIGCRDVRVLDRTELDYLAPRRVAVAVDLPLPGRSVCHPPGVGSRRRGSCIRGRLHR